MTTLFDSGGRLDWSSTNVIAFDSLGADDYFDVFMMNADGSEQRCLTCIRPELSNRHIGNPAWHPSGDYIVFQVQKSQAPANPVSDFFANPGSGINNDLWIMDRQGSRFWKLTDVELRNGGVLHPHFSPKGDKLLWSQRLSARGGRLGEWALEVADFTTAGGVPRIENLKQYQPGQQQLFYESHGFTPDGTKIIFSGNLAPGQDESGGDIYTLELATGALTNLTNTVTEWDEHAQIRPQGDWIVWMSSMGEGGMVDQSRPRTDYWIMRPDGSAKRQLTYFNVSGHAESIAGGATAADSSWNPDGTILMAYVILDQTRGTAKTELLEFVQAALTGATLQTIRDLDGPGTSREAQLARVWDGPGVR